MLTAIRQSDKLKIVGEFIEKNASEYSNVSSARMRLSITARRIESKLDTSSTKQENHFAQIKASRWSILGTSLKYLIISRQTGVIS